ncbi:phosphopantetheine-binding protein [Streptomyces sp. NBC_01537]|uniref:phosphopantetheine-binding protein n=1 Tax=Streptomyces sp. NBC_01537 TaxID=2903896 RepID=UPI003867E4F5
MTDTQFSDSDLATLLLAVGAEPPVGPGVFEDSFRDLDLDSLARTEIAARVVERWGVDVEERLTPETTPTQLRLMVEGEVAAR